MMSNNSFSLAMKFVPLSDQMTDGTPMPETNLQCPSDNNWCPSRALLGSGLREQLNKWRGIPTCFSWIFHWNIERAKVVKSSVGKRKVTESEALFREISHHRIERDSFELAASDALRLDWPRYSSNFVLANLCWIRIRALRYPTPWWQCLLCKYCKYKHTNGWRISSKLGCFKSKKASGNCLERSVARSNW